MKIDEINEAIQAAWLEQRFFLGQPVPLVGWLPPSSSKIHAPGILEMHENHLETAGIHKDLCQSMELTENIWKMISPKIHEILLKFYELYEKL